MSAAREVLAVSRVRGTMRVPGDKSTSHRALILSALASGRSVIRGLSAGEDVRATAQIMSRLGASVKADGAAVIVDGPDEGLRASVDQLECANSGTTMRLLAGVVSAIDGTHTLVGDASLSRRPMDRVAAPLALMGASVSGHGEHCHAPLTVSGSHGLRGVQYDVPVPSAQVKSAVLLAGLSAAGHTVVTEKVRTRSTTEDMLVHAGVALHSVDEGAGRRVTLTPGRPQPHDWDVPGDPSQAAFFVVLGLVHPDAEVVVRDVDASRERVGFVGVLERMGANLRVDSSDGALTLAAASSGLEATEVAGVGDPLGRRGTRAGGRRGRRARGHGLSRRGRVAPQGVGPLRRVPRPGARAGRHGVGRGRRPLRPGSGVARRRSNPSSSTRDSTTAWSWRRRWR